MANIKRYGLIAAASVAGYLSLLFGLSYALEGCVTGLVEDRLSASLGAPAKVETISLSLIRGRIDVRGIHVERRRGGHMELLLEHVRVDMAPAGWAVFDRDPRRVEVSGVELSISAAGALGFPERPKREPLHIGAMRLENVRITAMPTAFWPGLGRVEFAVASAETGPVRLASALDWVFALRSLDASTDLVAGIRADVHYTPGALGLSGSFVGAEPVVLPFTMPIPDPEALEAEKLRLLAGAVVEAVGETTIESWLRRKAVDSVRRLFK